MSASTESVSKAPAKVIVSRDDDLPRSITSKKLNGYNYMSWAHAVKVHLRGKKKLKYLTDAPPTKDDPALVDWESEDSLIMGWLWHSMEPSIVSTVEFAETSKQIWDTLASAHSQHSNVSRVYELYEQIFSTKQNGAALPDHYSRLKSLWDQLLQHRPFTPDLSEQRYWEEFMLASLLASLDSDFKGFKDQILASETLPTTANAYSRLLRSSLGQNPSSVSTSADVTALLSTPTQRGGTSFSRARSSRGRGSGRGRGGGRSQGRGDRQCTHCGGTNHTEPYCWVKYGKPDHVNRVTDSSSTVHSSGSELPSISALDTQEKITAQLSELLQTLRASPSTPTTVTLAKSGSSEQEDD